METADLSTRSCLIVEDEPLIGMDLEETVEAAGYRPQWAASLEAALALLTEKIPDAAIVDIVLRDKICLDLIRELKRRRVPFIVHSASNAGDGQVDLLGVPWLAKPTRPQMILDALNAACNGQSDLQSNEVQD